MTSNALSVPNTIQYNNNIFTKYIQKTGNNAYTTCLDLALKKILIESYLTNLGQYNFTNFLIINIPEKTESYTYTDYSQSCPEGWTSSDNQCYNWWNYTGKCNAGQWKTGYRNCSWKYNNNWWYNLWNRGSGSYTCDTYSYQLPGSNFSGYSDADKKGWEASCDASWPIGTASVTTRGYDQCNLETILSNTISPIGQILLSEDPLKYTVFYILKNNILPNKDAYFAYYSDGKQYNIFLSDTSNSDIFTNQGVYDSDKTSTCKSVNGSFLNFPVSVYKLSSSIYSDANFKKCASVNNSINYTNTGFNELKNKKNLNNNSIINKLNENYTNYEKNKYDNTAIDIKDNLNGIIKNLTVNYNKKAQLYNSTNDAIRQHDDILSDKNKKLNDQIDTMSKIQNDIVLKSRIIELNNETDQDQLFIKKIMQGFFVFLPLIIIILIIMYYGAISPVISLILIGLLVIGYIIYIVIINNMRKIKKFIKPLMGTLNQYENVVKKLYNDDYENECSNEEESEENIPINSKINNSKIIANGPFFYYDGSAPPEQIYPIEDKGIQVDTGDGIVVIPPELHNNLSNLKNPIVYIYYVNWIKIMIQNGIDFKTDLKLKSSYWDKIGLSLTTDFKNNIDNICDKYNIMRSDLGIKPSTYLIDTWSFFIGNMIPNDIYEKWLKKINDSILKNKDLKNIYINFYEYIIKSDYFTKKYSSEDQINEFLKIKYLDFIKFLDGISPS